MVGGVIMFIYYKVGDKVRIKSLDWYNENKSKITGIIYGTVNFIECMSKHCGQVATIIEAVGDLYKISLDNGLNNWSGNMFEGLVEEETKSNIIEEAKTYWDSIKDAWICPEGYIFKDENGNVINATKIVLEKKEKRYPTIYKECCDVLGLDTMDNDAQGYKAYLIIQFQELLIARDAYWKIAGDWKEKRKETSIHYVIYSTLLGEVVKDTMPNCIGNYLLDFPTQEMRDAFYENFKVLIEECKELLY